MRTYVTQEQFLTMLHGVENAIPRHRLAITAGVSIAVLDAVVRYIHALRHMGSLEEAQASELVKSAKQRVMALCSTEPDDNWYQQFAFVEPQTKEVAMILNRQPTPKQEVGQEPQQESRNVSQQGSVFDERDSVHFAQESEEEDDQDEESQQKTRTTKKDKRKVKRF